MYRFSSLYQLNNAEAHVFGMQSDPPFFRIFLPGDYSAEASMFVGLSDLNVICIFTDATHILEHSY